MSVRHDGLAMVTQSSPESTRQPAGQDEWCFALQPSYKDGVLGSEIVIDAKERPVPAVILGGPRMSPAKIIEVKYIRITDIRRREILLERGRDRANPVRRNLIVRERLTGLRIGECGKSSEVTVPHRLRRNGGNIERA